MNRKNVFLLVLVLAIVAPVAVTALKAHHRRAEAKARSTLVFRLGAANATAAICKYGAKANAPNAKASCDKASEEAAALPAVIDAYRQACRACASDQRCEDEIATIKLLGFRVREKSACDD